MVNPERDRRRLVQRRSFSLCVAVGLLTSVGAPSVARAFDLLQRAPRAAARAERALAAGDTLAAVESMLKAQSLAPEDPRLRLGLGEVLYRSGEMRAARSQFEALDPSDPESATLRPVALYDAGNAAFLEGDLEGALDLYTQALLESPAPDPDLLHNLELAQRMLEKQQQQQQQQQSQGPDEDSTGEGASESSSSEEGAQPRQDPPKEQPPGKDRGQDPGEQPDPQEDRAPAPQPQSDPQSEEASSPPPPAAAGADSLQVRAAPEEMTPEEAMRLLRALDFDEEELRKAIQRRLRGEETKSEHDW